jgi:hypothetical protein
MRSIALQELPNRGHPILYGSRALRTYPEPTIAVPDYAVPNAASRLRQISGQPETIAVVAKIGTELGA